MSFGRDGDGNRVFDSHQRVLDSFLEGGNLKSGYYVRPPLPENKRAVLRYLMANRGATMSQCSKHLDVLADKAIYDMAAIGYIEGDGRFLNQCRLFVTGKGRDATTGSIKRMPQWKSSTSPMFRRNTHLSGKVLKMRCA